MKTQKLTAACTAVALAVAAHGETATSQPTTQAASPKAVTAHAVGAAKSFLATLTTDQQAKVSYQFTDDEQRARWSNFPTGFVPRGGIALKDMSPTQQTAAMRLVASVLSAQGYQKVLQIMDADEYLKSQPDNGPGGGGRGFGGPRDGGPGGGPRDGGPTSRPDDGGPFGRRGGPGGPGGGGRGGPGGGGSQFGKDKFYISILGTPSETSPWMLQFGGHHLALNLTIVGDRGVLTPTLTAAQPARYTLDGKDYRVLAAESDKGLALLDALDAGQRKRTILDYRVGDLVLGPGHDGETLQPEGLKASAMTAPQRAMLLDLIGEWSGIVNDGYAAARTEQIKAGLDDTWFCWSGPTTREDGKNITAYYRIQGPKVIIEFSPQGTGGDTSNHVHTMYRDPTNDYGRASTQLK